MPSQSSNAGHVRPSAARGRVRHGVRDGAAVMAFSASSSILFAFALLALTHLAGGN